MTAIFKVECASSADSEKFQAAARQAYGVSWGEHVETVHGTNPWNTDRKWLVVVRSPVNGRLILTFTDEEAWLDIPAPTISIQEFVDNPTKAAMQMLCHTQQKLGTERVNALGRTTHGVLLINAMAKAVPSAELLKTFQPDHGRVDVELKINGHVVPLIPTFEDAWNRLQKTVDERALVLAKEAITGAGFDGIVELMAEFKGQIQERLRQQFPNRE